MGVKITLFPSYVITEKIFEVIPTTDVSGNITLTSTGDLGLLRDADVSTSFDIVGTASSIANGSIKQTFDFRKNFITALVSGLIKFTNTSTFGDYAIERSADGTNWTSIKTGSLNNTNATETISQSYFNVQYLRFTINASASINGKQTFNFYELRLMGS